MRDKILIIYKSQTGFTKRYAEMIAEETGAALAEYKNASAGLLSGYDTIVFGSRAHAGMIDGYKKIRELFQKSSADRLVLFVTGATPNAQEKVIEEFWRQNLKGGELSEIPHFYMQGGLCYERMSFSDRLMMKAAAAMLKKKKEKDSYDLEFEKAIVGSYDISSREYIEPLVHYLRELSAATF